MALSRAHHVLAGVAPVGVVSLTACSPSGREPEAAPEATTTATTAETTAEPTSEPTFEPTAEPTPAGPRRTSCRAVTHVGDSTSEALDSSAYLRREVQRLPSQLRQVGVKRVFLDIRGARSIVERWHDEPNAQEAVRAPIMDEVGDDQVMWLTVESRVGDGYYQDAHMQLFNRALLQACKRYPNLRVYDRRTELRREWFTSDGIHFTSEGYRQRSRRIAQALARAYPRDSGPSSDCVVTVTER